ncbi:MAG: hypothetical protein IPL11_19110 [Candidatus Accumulibacter sp.]|nr:hypothetical protein [Accumulibacter sp.]
MKRKIYVETSVISYLTICTPEELPEKKMLNDEIVDEVRAIRDTQAARFGYDARAIYEDLKKQRLSTLRPGIHLCLPPSAPQCPTFIAADPLRRC